MKAKINTFICLCAVSLTMFCLSGCQSGDAKDTTNVNDEISNADDSSASSSDSVDAVAEGLDESTADMSGNSDEESIAALEGETVAVAEEGLDEFEFYADMNGNSDEESIAALEGKWVAIEFCKSSIAPYTLKRYYFNGKGQATLKYYIIKETGFDYILDFEGTYYLNDNGLIYADMENEDGFDRALDYLKDEDILQLVTNRGRWNYYRIDDITEQNLIDDLREYGTSIIQEKYSNYVY